MIEKYPSKYEMEEVKNKLQDHGYDYELTDLYKKFEALVKAMKK